MWAEPLPVEPDALVPWEVEPVEPSGNVPLTPEDTLVSTVCVCAGSSLVVSVWVLAPPVSSAVSKSESDELIPTGTLPAPKAAHVPKANNVAGLVLFVAFI